MRRQPAGAASLLLQDKEELATLEQSSRKGAGGEVCSSPQGAGQIKIKPSDGSVGVA